MLVKSLDDIFSAALQLSAGTISVDDIEFENDFTVIIRLRGEQWDGKVDYKIARFVLSLQQAVFNVFNESSPKRINFRSATEDIEKLRVKVDIENGSTELIVAFTELLKAIQGLPSAVGSAVLISVGTLFGFYAIKNTIGGFHERAKEIAKIDSERDVRLAELDAQKRYAETVEKSLVIVSENTKATLELAKSLSEKDIIVVNGRELSSQEAIEAYYVHDKQDLQDEVSSLTFKIDEKFQVKAAFIEKQEVQISYRGAKSFKATTRDMPQRDKEDLYKQFAEADMLAIAPTISLQVNILVADGVIAHAAIIKIGNPRPGTVTIFKALESSLEAASKQIQSVHQLNLLALDQK